MGGAGDKIPFSGSIPERDDRLPWAALFEPYALDLAARLPKGAKRLLALAGGTFLFNVWDSLRFNPATRITPEAIAALFPADPPRFYEIPIGFSNAETIRGLLDDAGFGDLSIDLITKRSHSPSARDYAAGLVTGTPMANQIQERGGASLERVTDAMAATLEAEFGAGAIDAPMRALVVTARVAP